MLYYISYTQRLRTQEGLASSQLSRNRGMTGIVTELPFAVPSGSLVTEITDSSAVMLLMLYAQEKYILI